MFSAFLFDASSPQVVASFSEVISTLLIKAPAFYDFVHAFWYEITNGTIGRNPVSNFGCGYVDVAMNNLIWMIGGFPGPIQDDKLHQVLDITKPVPFG